MKKKILFLLILLITGCSANYNLNIENDNFEESIDVIVPSNDKALISHLNSFEQYINENVIYDKKIKEGDISTNFNYSHTYSFNDFQNRENPCFLSSNLYQDNGIYTIFSNDFVCFESFDMKADSYKINISTNYNVINNNADKVNGNTYTWNFKKNNYKNKSIIFQYSKTKKEVDDLKIVKTVLISISISLFLFLSIIIFKKYKQKDEV